MLVKGWSGNKKTEQGFRPQGFVNISDRSFETFHRTQTLVKYNTGGSIIWLSVIQIPNVIYLKWFYFQRFWNENGLGQASAHTSPPHLRTTGHVKVDYAARAEWSAFQLSATARNGRKFGSKARTST